MISSKQIKTLRHCCSWCLNVQICYKKTLCHNSYYDHTPWWLNSINRAHQVLKVAHITIIPGCTVHYCHHVIKSGTFILQNTIFTSVILQMPHVYFPISNFATLRITHRITERFFWPCYQWQSSLISDEHRSKREPGSWLESQVVINSNRSTGLWVQQPQVGQLSDYWTSYSIIKAQHKATLQMSDINPTGLKHSYIHSHSNNTVDYIGKKTHNLFLAFPSEEKCEVSDTQSAAVIAQAFLLATPTAIIPLNPNVSWVKELQ